MSSGTNGGNLFLIILGVIIAVRLLWWIGLNTTRVLAALIAGAATVGVLGYGFGDEILPGMDKSSGAIIGGSLGLLITFAILRIISGSGKDGDKK